MSTNVKRIARTVGALFLISNATFILGAMVFIEAVLSRPDYLVAVSGSGNQLTLGVLLELVNGFAYIGIAVLMFPIFRQRYESMALGYFGLRVIEFVMQVAAGISLLLLLSLSQEAAAVGAGDSSTLQTLAMLLIDGRTWSFQMLSLAFGLSALFFYFMFYQMVLVPRFIAVWGLIGAMLVLTNTLLAFFGIKLGSSLELVTGLPMLLNEVFLGVWLIVKGFNDPVIAPESATPAASLG